MKSKEEEKKQKSFEKDYNEIMKEALKQTAPPPTPQWTNPGDYIVKFSLYEETPNSITSTDTCIVD